MENLFRRGIAALSILIAYIVSAAWESRKPSAFSIKRFQRIENEVSSMSARNELRILDLACR